MTKAKDGYLGNPNLKPIGIQQQFTPEQVKEYIKCANDPSYFIKKFVKIVAVDKGLVPFELYDFQEELINILHNNRFVIGKLPRQVGKCLDIYTKVAIRNKKTGEIKEMTVGELYETIKNTEESSDS